MKSEIYFLILFALISGFVIGFMATRCEKGGGGGLYDGSDPFPLSPSPLLSKRFEVNCENN